MGPNPGRGEATVAPGNALAGLAEERRRKTGQRQAVAARRRPGRLLALLQEGAHLHRRPFAPQRMWPRSPGNAASAPSVDHGLQRRRSGRGGAEEGGLEGRAAAAAQP
eukprot:5504308-Alexandrium_andersonii.AAC.1